MRGNFNNRRRDRGNNNNGNPFNGGNGSTTGTDRTNNQSNSSGNFHETAETTKAFSDRLDYLMASSIGSEVTATVNSAVKYSGLLVACNLESVNGIDIILKYPKIVDNGFTDNIEELSEQLGETLLINGSDVAELEMKGIDLTLDEKWEVAKRQELEDKQKKESQEDSGINNNRNSSGNGKSFKTDIDISQGRGGLKERELQKWTPDAADEVSHVNHQTLEESSSTWDQFIVNEEKFGVKSTYDEHLYTTKINKNAPNYEKRAKEAERLAKEIESQGSSGNIHLAEDRGITIDDSGMDEEDLYSGVDRRGNDLLASLKSNSKPSPAKPAAYVAPSLRNQPHHTDPAIISSTTTKNVVKKQVPAANKNSQVAPATDQSDERSDPDSCVAVSKVPGDSKKETPSPKQVNSKEAQIEELKKFAQKFKVPYDIPEDMKDILKNSTLKSDPSLPPKPQAGSNKSSVPPTPSNAKADIRKNPASKISSQGATPINSPSAVNSPSTGRASVSSRRRGAASFFGSKIPSADNNKKELFNEKFNMFIQSKAVHNETIKKRKEKSIETKSMEVFFIEKPYFTAPTWLSTIEQSYKSLFPDEGTAMQRAQINLQQRQMNNMNAAAAAAAANQQMGIVMGNMMRFPMGPGASPNIMNGMSAGNMSMYMPFQPQPMFYPSMPHMMSMMGSTEEGGRSPSPQAASPHVPPAYMNNAPSGSFGYPGGIPFQGMMGGGNNPGVSGGNGSYRQNYHHHNGQNNYNHNNNHGNHRNNHENH